MNTFGKGAIERSSNFACRGTVQLPMFAHVLFVLFLLNTIVSNVPFAVNAVGIGVIIAMIASWVFFNDEQLSAWRCGLQDGSLAPVGK